MPACGRCLSLEYHISKGNEQTLFFQMAFNVKHTYENGNLMNAF